VKSGENLQGQCTGSVILETRPARLGDLTDKRLEIGEVVIVL
jgi:hypothetical protein